MDRNLRLLGVGSAIQMLGSALYNPFLALFLVNVLHVAYLEVGLLIALVGVVLLPFNVLGGLYTDRIGRKQLLLLGLLGETLATGGLAYAFEIESLPLAVLAATAGGVVTTFAGPAVSAYIADFAEGSERTRGFTFYRIGFNAGFSAGVTLGGVLIAEIGFAGSVAAATVVIAGGALFLALTLAPSPRDLELRKGRPVRGTEDPPGPRGPSMGESFRRLAQDRVALELLVAVALASLIAGQWAVTFPLFVHNVLGVPYAVLGIGLALNGLVVVFGQSPTTEAVIGRRHTGIAILGLTLYGLAFLGLGAAGRYDIAPVAVFFAAVAVLTLGENLLSIPAATLPSNLAPKGEIGSYNGAFAMVGGIGFILSVLVGGAVLSVTSDPLGIWLLLMAPAVPAVLLLRHAAGRLTEIQDTA